MARDNTFLLIKLNVNSTKNKVRITFSYPHMVYKHSNIRGKLLLL